jgi:hypothetical protein
LLFPVAGVEIHPAVPPLIGFCVGTLSGLFGVGGGWLVAPILMWIGVPPHRAVGSELNQMIAASSSGAVLHARRRNVSARLGLVVAAAGLAAGLGGTALVSALLTKGSYERPMGVLYTVLLLAIGVRIFAELGRPAACAVPDDGTGLPPFTRRRYLAAAALGLFAGVLSAFLGVGGGVVLVPAMIYLLAVPTRLAIGTSLLQVVCIAFGTTVFHAALNQDVDVVLAAMIMAGSLPGSCVGVWLCGRLKTRSLRGLFGLMALAVAARMAYGVARGRQSALEAGEVSFDELGPFLRGVRELALGHPFLYGLAAATFALAVGLAWGRLFRGRAGCGDDPGDGGRH